MDNLLSYKGIDIHLESILDLNVEKKWILVRASVLYHKLAEPPEYPNQTAFVMKIIIKDGRTFNGIKFSFIKYIKTKANPDDRVADFEFRDENGLLDFDKLDRLIEMRKTREEKQEWLNSELELKEAFEKHDLEYNGPLGRVN